jgi:hypothetical protein
MRIQFSPPSATDWTQYHQHGGLLIGFKGKRYQRGAGLGNILKSLFRMVIPLAKSAGKVMGKQALQSGKEIAGDLLSGENVRTTLEKRGKEAAGQLIEKGARRLVTKLQTGKGLGNRKKQSKSIKRLACRRKPHKKDALGLI